MKKLLIILSTLTFTNLYATVPKFSKKAVILVRDKGKTYCFSPDKYEIVKKSKSIRNLNQTKKAKNNIVTLFAMGPLDLNTALEEYDEIMYPDVGLQYNHDFKYLNVSTGITLGGWGLLGIGKSF